MFAIVASPTFQYVPRPQTTRARSSGLSPFAGRPRCKCPDVERQDYQQCGLEVFKFFPADVLARPEMHPTMRDGAQCIMLRGRKYGSENSGLSKNQSDLWPADRSTQRTKRDVKEEQERDA